MFISIVPMGKPRMTQRDRWAKRPTVIRYHQFADELRLQYRQTLPDMIDVTFYLPMPKSWSAKKKATMLGKPHQAKPDIDNLLKAVMDILKPEGDATVHTAWVSKFWSDNPGIDINEIPCYNAGEQ